MNLQTIVGSKNRVKVLRELMSHDGQSGRQVAANAGIAPSASKTSLEELVECGLVLQEQDRGRIVHHLNRSHYLVSPLEKLFAEERLLPERLVDDVRRHLRTLDPPVELVCVGIGETGSVTLAASPPIAEDAPSMAALTKQLRFKYGMQIIDCVATPAEVAPENRVWSLRRAESRSERLSSQTRRRALRFFGIEDPRELAEGLPTEG